MANITILNIAHTPEQLTAVEFETDTGVHTRVGIPGIVTDHEQIKDHIRSTYKITADQLENECGPTEEWLATRYRSQRAPEHPPLS